MSIVNLEVYYKVDRLLSDDSILPDNSKLSTSIMKNYSILAQGELGQLVGAVNIWAHASLPGGRAFSLLKVLKVKNFVCTFMSAHFS